MDRQEFMGFLQSEEEHFDIAEAPLDGKNGVYVKNKTYDTETHFTNEVIANMELEDLLVATHQGRNIEHMTRVTGYFSKVAGWNKGKLGELKDRSRVSKV